MDRQVRSNVIQLSLCTYRSTELTGLVIFATSTSNTSCHRTSSKKPLLKANQKQSLDDLVIQKGEFDYYSLFGDEIMLNIRL